MPTFPKKEADVVVLANTMISGYFSHPESFPNAAPVVLNNALQGYGAVATDARLKTVEARQATEHKDFTLENLRVEMERQIAQSILDTQDDPVKLEQIGWHEQAAPGPLVKPGMPRVLAATAQLPNIIHLDWKPPAPGSGGEVRVYLVMRRDKSPGGAFGEWAQIDLALEPDIILTNQPIGRELEYRVFASNRAGLSVPSNTVMAVL